MEQESLFLAMSFSRKGGVEEVSLPAVRIVGLGYRCALSMGMSRREESVLESLVGRWDAACDVS